MKKTILFLFTFLLLIPLVDAAKVSQTFVGGADGLEIRVPQAEFVEQNVAGQLNLHVFNKSDGLLVDNTTTECFLHLFNKTGHHIIEDKLEFDDEDNDFFIDINAANFSQLGFHSFIVQCNNSRFGGFVSGSIEVTEDGTEETIADVIKIMAALLGVLILVATFIILAFNLGEEHYLLKLFFMFMAIITITVIPQLIIKGISSAEANILNIPLWAFRIFVIYVSVYIFYNWAVKSERFMRWFGSQK